MKRDVYSGYLKLKGGSDEDTLLAAHNYAATLHTLKRHEEAKSLLRKTMPVARRVLGEDNETRILTRWIYADALYTDPCATLDELREAVTTLGEIERTARRVLGAAHPTAMEIERSLRLARAALRAREGDGSNHAGGTRDG